MQTDHDLLIEISTLVKATHKALYGNGQPGVLHKVSTLEEQMKASIAEAHELRAAVPTKKEKALVNSGILTGILISVFAAIKAVLFGS